MNITCETGYVSLSHQYNHLLLNYFNFHCSLNMSMADFVDDLLTRRGYEKRIRPGADTGMLGKYSTKIDLIKLLVLHVCTLYIT